MSGRLVIMGSGENAPAMVKLHRTLMEQVGDGPRVMIDTPFGFQVNADDLTAKYQQYFEESVGQRVDLATWKRRDGSPVEQERTLALIGRADWVFAGPGSPSYALHHWQGTPIPHALDAVLARGGTLVIGSAAAATLGSKAIPVYEIYKVGLDPYWLDGLDLLGRATGISAVIVPHFDNREGGRHDTSCCYIGLTRLEQLEAMLPAQTGVIGVDEHTAVVLDLTAQQVTVHGAGGLTLRRSDEVRVFPASSTVPLADIAMFIGSSTTAAATNEPTPTVTEGADARTRFDACLAAGDATGAAAACLEVEQQCFTAPSDEAHQLLRTMIVELADAARAGLQDPRVVLAPVVEVALDIRRAARENKDYAMSDLVRDSLAAVGIEVRDTPEGMVWQ